ncbi:hypothetical protein V8C42DRAFT_359295 [Trichoderma barbatum]
MTYLGKLKHAFQLPPSANRQSNPAQLLLTESRLLALPWLRTRKWTDDSGLEYDIISENPAGEDDMSEAALTGQSFKDIDISIDGYFQTIEKLCEEETPETRNRLLKNLMRMTLELWKGARTRSAVKSRLRRYFGEYQTKRNEAEKTLRFMSKIYYNARNFIEAAEKLPMFKSVRGS